MTRTIEIGDRVMYAAAFLRATGQYTGENCFMRGEVTGEQDLGHGFRLLIVEWDRRWNRSSTTINAANLVHESKIAEEAAR